MNKVTESTTPPFILVGTNEQITASLLKVHVQYTQPVGARVGVLLGAKRLRDFQFTFWSRKGDRIVSESLSADVVKAIREDFRHSALFGSQQFGVLFLN